MSVESLLEQIKMDTEIWMSPIHGLDHWKRVEAVGLELAYKYGGDPETFRYFAILHDCMRIDEGCDPCHGPRTAEYAKTKRDIIRLNEFSLKVLIRACAGHTHAHQKKIKKTYVQL